MKIIDERRIQLTPDLMSSRTFRGAPPSVPRSPGVHVSAVNRALGIAAKKLTDSDRDDYPFELASAANHPLMWTLGTAWEEMRASMYAEDELLWQPFELERDKIYGTPDGLLISEPEAAFWECKQTTKKIQSIADCWMYVKQGLSYCAMTHGATVRVRYEVCWVLGDYSRPYQPLATSTLVEFREGECETWWTNVKAAAGRVKAE